MDKVKNIVAYFCLKYPHENELSKARLTKLVYLADWVSALVCGKQLTNIKWIFNHYGPYVNDVVETARNDINFNIIPARTYFGGEKYIISFNGDEDDIDLTSKEKDILNAIIEKTKTMYFNDFIDYVYSTYPVRSQERYSYLNLVELAKEYKSNESN